jgi:arylsulfatase A-like enzyme
VRRSPLPILLLAAAAAGLPAASCAGPEGSRPNVVLVVWDTCRADRLSAYGHPRPTTPRLEEFARRGVRYARAFTPAPWTAPAHASLFSGLALHRHGLEVGRGDRVHPSVPLLAETLRNAGYQTAGFSANAYVSSLTGLSRGFQWFETVHDPVTEAHDADRLLRSVRAWLEVRRPDPAREGPFFLFFNFMDTHLPLAPSRVDVDAVRGPEVTETDLFAGSRVDPARALLHLLGVVRVDGSALRGLRARYDGAARHLDRRTGELLDLLREKGFLGDALVVVTSDHGENLGEHGQLDHRLSMYDTLLHVPLVVHRPGRYEGGGVVEAEVSLMDVHPTVLAEAGVPVPPGAGLDARPLPPRGGEGRPLLGEFASVEAHLEEIRAGLPGVAESVLDPLRTAIASARDPASRPDARKYIRWTRKAPSGGEATVREELYDTRSDPGEERDLLAGGDPGARAAADRLAAEIDRMRREGTR